LNGTDVVGTYVPFIHSFIHSLNSYLNSLCEDYRHYSITRLEQST